MHQKILRELCLDKFSQIASKCSDSQWESLVNHIIQHNFSLSIKELTDFLKRLLPTLTFTLRDREALWEAFKLKPNLEDNPDSLDERQVSLQALVNARKQTRQRRLKELIGVEEEDTQAVEEMKMKG